MCKWLIMYANMLKSVLSTYYVVTSFQLLDMRSKHFFVNLFIRIFKNFTPLCGEMLLELKESAFGTFSAQDCKFSANKGGINFYGEGGAVYP